ncbi:hypothetical protein Q5752_002886 [Cryptotrichosporon argae]
MSFLSSFATSNLSYHLLPLVWLQAQYAGTRGACRRLGFPDNVAPREVIGEMERSGRVPKRVVDKVKRRDAAHANCLEGLPLIFAAVLAGNHAGLSPRYMNAVVLSYFGIRCAYIWLYINIADQRRSWARSVVWWAGNFCSIVTLWRAGNALNARA